MEFIWKKYGKDNCQDYQKLVQYLKREFPDSANNFTGGSSSLGASEDSKDIYVLFETGFDWNKPLLWVKHSKSKTYEKGYVISINGEHPCNVDPKYLNLVTPKIKELDKEKLYIEELEKDRRDYDTLVELEKKECFTSSELIFVYSLYSKFDLAKDIIEGKTEHHRFERDVNFDYVYCEPSLKADFIVATLNMKDKKGKGIECWIEDEYLIEACIKSNLKALIYANKYIQLCGSQVMSELLSYCKNVESEQTRSLIIDNLFNCLSSSDFGNVNFLCEVFTIFPDLLFKIVSYEDMEQENLSKRYWSFSRFYFFEDSLKNLDNQSIILDSLLEGLVSAKFLKNKALLLEKIRRYFDNDLLKQKLQELSYVDKYNDFSVPRKK